MKVKTGILLSIFLLVAMIPVTSAEDDPLIQTNTPIKYWRADKSVFKIESLNIFPVYSEKGLPMFGEAYIVWLININGQILPVYSHFKQGKIISFRIFDISDNAQWFYSGTELLLVETAKDSTKITWISAVLGVREGKLQYRTKNITALFRVDPEKPLFSYWEIQFFANNTKKLYSINFSIFGFSDVKEENNKLIDTWLLFSISKGRNGETYYSTPYSQKLLQIELTETSQLGLISINPDDPFDSNMGVFDLENNQIFDISANKTYKFPGDSRMSTLHKFGITSSLVINNLGEMFEYKLGEWRQIPFITPWKNLWDTIFIDIGLIVSVGVENGIVLKFFGEDEDGDGLPSKAESYYGTNSFNEDTDSDGVSDMTEVAYGTDATKKDQSLDYDRDGVSNGVEYKVHTDPLLEDTDFGGASDGFELKYKLNPLDAKDDREDNDKDGLTNAQESEYGTNPFKSDTDNDGIPDGWEVKNGLDPRNPFDRNKDYDNDGRDNIEEFLHKSSPIIRDLTLPFEGNEIGVSSILFVSTIITIIFYRQICPNFGNYKLEVQRGSNKKNHQ